MALNYDRIAPFYDVLSRGVFGKKLLQAKHPFITALTEKSPLLIVGGGTGSELSLLEQKGYAGKVYFVEASSKMIQKASKRTSHLHVEYIHNSWPTELPEKVGGIMAHFYLDQFTDKNLSKQVDSFIQLLKKGGYISFADFRPTNHYPSKLLIKAMYAFFKVVAGLRTQRLEDPTPLFKEKGLESIQDNSSPLLQSILFKLP